MTLNKGHPFIERTSHEPPYPTHGLEGFNIKTSEDC